MRQEEFFQSFQEALAGEVSDGIIQENVTYYKNYIYEESQKGRTVDEIIDSLGNPRLLAKTIINTTNLAPNYREDSYSKTYDSERNDGGWEEAEDHRSFKQRIREFNMPHWLRSVLSVIVIAVCIGIGFAVISYLAPFIVLVICIIGIIKFIRNISDG